MAAKQHVMVITIRDLCKDLEDVFGDIISCTLVAIISEFSLTFSVGCISIDGTILYHFLLLFDLLLLVLCFLYCLIDYHFHWVKDPLDDPRKFPYALEIYPI